MAIADLRKSTLQLVLNDGTNMDTGEPVFKYKSFNNIKTTATADQLYAVATAFASLQERVLYNTIRKDDSEIIGV
ncbi:DUF1659 domain-containing protein [Oceanobacillus bengalensis]|uniref:DUF1659 domain-containing protein n=1 Tax=Oceanobacillus bengalensis TaxID=1435466 RepID=A0A494Z291_9BACI|nr:DUF1659 domain-containing protein [Oceanobacillus bengalensis]RKQ16603.1 DUF1659 domain-containing protein [Oceanobacillus bengalensis]